MTEQVESTPVTGSASERAVEVERVPVGDGRCVAAVVYLNRPDALNAITWSMIEALELELRAAEADDDVCAVLVTGRGRGFSAGGDLKGYVELQQDPKAFHAFITDLHRTFASIATMSKPVIALVNGITAAGGLELMLSCDFAWAASSARIGDLHLNYGQMGGGGVLALLPRTVGANRARELIFSARLLDAAEALEWGLVTRVLPDDELLPAGLELAAGIAAKSPAGIRWAKDVLHRGSTGMDLESALRLEADAAVLYCTSLPDSMEGLQAFAERRTPEFPGR